MDVTEQDGRLGHRVHYGDRDGIGNGYSYRSFVSCRSGKLRFHRGSKRERDINTRLSARPAETRGAAGGPLSPALPHHVSTLHHIHCTPLQWCTQTLSLHTSSHLCTAPFPPRATATSWPGGQPALSLELLASPLQYPHIPLCSAVHLSLRLDLPSLCPSWAHGHMSMCTQAPPGMYKSILCLTSASAVQYSCAPQHTCG